MTHVRQILLTALLALTVVSVGLLVGCDRRQSFGFGGSYYSGSSRLYPRSTSYGGYVYSSGNISRIHSRSYPSYPLVIRRGYRTSGYYSPHTSRRTHYYRPSGHSTGRGSSSYRSGSHRSSGHSSSGRSGHR